MTLYFKMGQYKNGNITNDVHVGSVLYNLDMLRKTHTLYSALSSAKQLAAFVNEGKVGVDVLQALFKNV